MGSKSVWDTRVLLVQSRKRREPAAQSPTIVELQRGSDEQTCTALDRPKARRDRPLPLALYSSHLQRRDRRKLVGSPQPFYDTLV